MRGYADAKFFTFMKFVVVLGTIDFDIEGGEERIEFVIEKINKNAQWADGLGYCKKLPFLFFIMNVINFFRGVR